MLLLAFFPFIFIIFLLFFLKQSVVKTSVYGLLVTCAIGMLPPFRSERPMADAINGITQGMEMTFPVAYVLIAGMLMYVLLQKTGAFTHLSAWIEHVTGDPLRRTLLIAAGISPFLESAIGFGIAIVFSAPLFRTLGHSHTKTALLSLMTLHMVPWGAMAIGTRIGASIAGVPLQSFGTSIYLLSFPLITVMVFMVCLYSAGWDAVKKQWYDLFLALILLLGSLFVVTYFLSMEIAGIIAGFFTIGALVFLWKNRREKADHSTISLPLIPLSFFIGGTLSVKLFSFFFTWGEEFVLSHPYLTNPATFMMLACILQGVLSHLSLKEWKNRIKEAIIQAFPAVFSTFGFVITGAVMKSMHLSDTILLSLSGMGAMYIYLAPWMGGLSGWIAGSNSGGNAIWMQIQADMATMTGSSTLLLAAAQNTAASYLMMASPSRILLASSVAGPESSAPDVLRNILRLSLFILFLLTAELFFFY